MWACAGLVEQVAVEVQSGRGNAAAAAWASATSSAVKGMISLGLARSGHWVMSKTSPLHMHWGQPQLEPRSFTKSRVG